MTTSGNTFKRRCHLLLKCFCIFPFLLLAVWLLQLVYLPDVAISTYFEPEKPDPEREVFKAILTQNAAIPREHFHIIDDYVTRSEPMAPLCLNCHGTYPHSKEKKIRSILNFHNGFIACSVCHARKRPGDKEIGFAWVDRVSGDIEERVEGAYGKYPAKIFPVRTLPDKARIILRPIDENAARHYMKFKDIYSPDQIAQAKIKLHANISPKPVFCSECHQKKGYLDFAALGFPPQRVAHLNSSEVVGLIDKYKTFYMPAEIDFGTGQDLQ